MRKTVKLTERDLTRLVNKVLDEQIGTNYFDDDDDDDDFKDRKRAEQEKREKKMWEKINSQKPSTDELTMKYLNDILKYVEAIPRFLETLPIEMKKMHQLKIKKMHDSLYGKNC